MEDIRRWTAITAVAPVAWGTTYYVTRHVLPEGYPLYGAVLRALPAGLLLLAIRPARPHGSWWWRFIVLGTLNVAAFFALVYLAAQLLPTGVASSIMATSSVVLMLLAWALLAERPAAIHLLGGAVGVSGVALMVLTSTHGVRPAGVLASLTAMTSSSLGYTLARRWGRELDLLPSTAWQLIFGAALLLPVAVVVEGRPPHIDPVAALGFGYLTVVGTALAFVCWFAGLRRLQASTVGLVGLLNPVTGVLLGTLVTGERLSERQVAGLGLVLVGVLLGQRVRPRRTSAPHEPVVEPTPTNPRDHEAATT